MDLTVVGFLQILTVWIPNPTDEHKRAIGVKPASIPATLACSLALAKEALRPLNATLASWMMVLTVSSMADTKRALMIMETSIRATGKEANRPII